MEQDIKKAESRVGFATPGRSEKGSPNASLTGSLALIQDIKKEELRMPRRLCTFDEMAQDPCVKQPMEVTQLMTWLALQGGEWVPGKNATSASKEAAKFLNYNIHNMSNGFTWSQFCTDAVTCLKYGFALFNIVTEIRSYGQYSGSRVLKKLSPRSQHSLYGWLFDSKGREVKGIVQRQPRNRITIRPSEFGGAILTSNVSSIDTKQYVTIYNKNLLRLTHQGTNNNPQGESALVACFDPWMEKNIIQQYEVIGVSKDLGGIVVVRVKQELLERARDPEKYPDDWRAYVDLEEQIANIHAGKQSYIILSDEIEQNHHSYDLKLLGIEGGGKQYKTSEIIEQKRKDIYNCWGAGYLLLGQDSHGSYNLSSNNKQIHSFYAERDTKEIVDVLNSDLAPKILASNKVYLDYDEMPIFRPKDPDQLSIDEFGKFLQRAGSVQKLTEAMTKHGSRLAGFPEEGIEDLDFTSKGDSRSGESQGSSGTGTTQDGGIASATNSDNSGVTKKYIIDDSFSSEDQIVAVEEATGNHIFIDKGD